MSLRKVSLSRKFEALEDRRMMAADVEYNAGTITIDGTGEDDVATVRFEGNRVYVGIIDDESDEDDEDNEPDSWLISNVSQIVFNGYEGNDTLNVNVENLDSGVTVANVELHFSGGDDNDELFQTGGGIKTSAYGGLGNDTLQASRFDDSLSGEGGDDTYIFAGTRLGRDYIVNEAANADSDTLDFSGYAQAVNVNLSAWLSILGPSPSQHAVDQSNLRVTLFDDTAIENVIGTQFGDHITGNSRDNKLEGGAGSDIYHFDGTNLGTDEIVEADNADSDGLDFSDVSQGLTIDLTKFGTNYAVNSTAVRVILANDTAIERVWGTDFGDTITGNSRDNRLWGRGGNDTIRGNLGVDYLYGGADVDFLWSDLADLVYGGSGRDFFNMTLEGLTSWTNPRPGSYMDWGVV